jgi:predicted Zn-dependent protease
VLELAGESACDYPVELGTSSEVNAYADGQRIVIELGMMRVAQRDEELALVIAHELAHNAMGHSDAAATNAVLGGALGLLADIALGVATNGVYVGTGYTEIGAEVGAEIHSVEFEQEADYVGMYILKRAGFPIGDAPDFWRRMAMESPDTIKLRTTHPTSPERFVALKAAIAEIEEKVAGNRPLLPELIE